MDRSPLTLALASALALAGCRLWVDETLQPSATGGQPAWTAGVGAGGEAFSTTGTAGGDDTAGGGATGGAGGADAPTTSGGGAAATCDDAMRNADESDVDCGGSCPGCPLGSTCVDGADCATGICVGSRCAECGSHGDCAGNHDCDAANVYAPKKGEGASCTSGVECLTGECDDGECDDD